MRGPPRSQAHSRRLVAVTFAFFIVFLVLGILVFRDYGLSWDELTTREYGLMNVAHAIPNARALDSLRAAKGVPYQRFGPIYEILLVRVELLLPRMDPRSVMLMRHLATFLIFFVGVVCFYLFCRQRFGPGITLVASMCLALNPLLFSHAFYNLKDIAFLTTFLATMLTLDAMLRRPSWRSVILHGATTAVLMATRVIGVFAMLLTAGAALVRRPTRRTVLMLVVYGVVVMLLLPLFWPVLRIDPIGIVKDALLGATTNPYGSTDLFRGRVIVATALPWDYVPTWILITTPFVISALFIVGTAAVGIGYWRHSVARLRDLVVCCWLFLPVLGCMILRPVMYDGWRHLFFVYPALLYLAAVGMETLNEVAVARLGEAKRQLVSAGLTAALFLCLAPALSFMLANHPFEHLYFNRLAGRDMQEIKQRFELDYWGLSYRKALEYIVRADSAPVIRVYVANVPGRANVIMLLPRDRARVVFVSSSLAADYFITNYRWHPQPYVQQREVFSVRVGDASIASVFQLRPAP